MENRFHQEIGGGYAMGPAIIVDMRRVGDEYFETMAMKPDGDEIETVRSYSRKQAENDFDEMVMKYAEPIQKTILGANMRVGKKYTIFSYSEFGMPMAHKFTYYGDIECCTYAQYRDAVKFKICPEGKRGVRYYMIYKGSFAIVEGWKELPDELAWNVVARSKHSVMKASKYQCWDARYFEDIKKVLKNVVAVYENIRIGADGRRYA